MDDITKQLANNMGVQIVNLNLQIVDLQAQGQKLTDELKEKQEENIELKTQLKALRNSKKTTKSNE